MPWFVPLIVAGATAAYQAIKGAKQKREARSIQRQADEQERANLADARRMALNGLPESQYQRSLQQIYGQQALGLSALRDRRSALAGISSLQQGTNEALMDLNARDAAARRDAERIALNQSNRMSGLTGERAAQTRYSGEALTGAAIQNLSNAAMTSAYIYGGGNSSNGTGAATTGTTKTGSGMSPNGFNLNSSLWGPNGYSGVYNSNPYAKPY
jgi:hypothetical protein